MILHSENYIYLSRPFLQMASFQNFPEDVKGGGISSYKLYRIVPPQGYDIEPFWSAENGHRKSSKKRHLSNKSPT